MSLRKVCPQCGTAYGAESRFCSVDGATLVLEQPADELVGRIVADRYHIIERIGIGGMGQVFLAEHVRMKRKSAIKIMREGLTGDPVAVSRFHREAENASQINHPNVAAVYDFGETPDGLVYIAMEYIPGQPLSHVLAVEGALNPARVGDIIVQAADALAAAHALGILHRDLKPDNIMLTSTRWGTDLVKLVDFGISRAMASATQQFTSTGMIVGTPDYMSPEQFTADAMDSRSDQYSLALIAFNALTGAFPFPTGGSKESLLGRLTNAPRRLAEVRPDVAWPEALQRVLDRALALDVQERFTEVTDFAREFETALAEVPPTAEMDRYREALMQRYATPSRAAAITPARALPSLEATPVSPMPAAAPHTVAARPVRTMRARTALAAAVTLLVALVAWQLLSGEDAAPGETSAFAPADSAPDSLATASGVPAPSPALAAGPAASAPFDSLVATARRGVFSVYGEGDQALGFLVDSSGIVVTTAAVVLDGEPRVQLAGERRVQGRVMALDSARGVAALRIPMQHCRECSILRLADATIPATPGDSLALAAPRGAGADARGTVLRSDARGVQAALAVSTATVGAPVLDAAGRVLGVATSAGRQPRLVGAAALETLRQNARRRRSEVLPNDTLLPTWPATPLPRAELRAGAERSDADARTFQIAGDGFAVFVMTPHVMAWRQERINVELEAARVMSLDNNAAPRLVDPIQLWRGWTRYVGDRRAVVVLHATPELAAHGRLNRRLVTDLRRGDVAAVRLLRDGVAVRPIEEARIPAVVNAEAYRAAGQHVYGAAVAVYHPRDFAPAGGRAPDLRLELTDARTRRSSTMRIPDAVIAAVQRDLAAYMR